MERIKKIYCLGSSFTAGGGFEFDSDGVNEFFPSMYSHLGEELTPFNFSWPGQLQKLIGSDIEVINLAKQGFGNHRTERLVYDIIQSDDFIKEESLFLIELTALGRDELFCSDLDDYIVCNYTSIDNSSKFKFSGSAKDYFYQSKQDESIVDSYNDFFEKYINDFKDLEDEMNKLTRSIDFFLSYLDLKSINYLLTSPPISYDYYDKSKCIEYGDGKYFSKNDCFADFSFLNKMTIKDETNGFSEDMHCGFKANKLISNIIYNKLVDSKFIEGNIKEIDWNWYKKVNLLNK